MPKYQTYDYVIEIKKGKTFNYYSLLYQISGKELKVLKEYLKEKLAKEHIRESKSPARSPTMFVPKKDSKLRLVVDYRKLNTITMRDSYALLLADKLRDWLGQAVVFTKLDLRDAFNLIKIKKGDKWKTAFRCRYRYYEYLVTSMRLTNTLATMMRMINNVFRECLDIFAIMYLDDILIYSESNKEHIEHVNRVLELLRSRNFRLKLSKCEFHVKQTTFLRIVISKNGVQIDSAKVQSARMACTNHI